MRRDHTNYPGLTVTVPAPGVKVDFDKILKEGTSAIETDDLFVIPARIHLSNYFMLTFRTWRSIEHFETFQDPILEYQRKIRVQKEGFDEFYQENKDQIDFIYARNLNFLEIGKAKHESTDILIDIDDLYIRGKAKRKERNQTTTRIVDTPEEFELVKTEEPEFAPALINFAISYGQSKSGFLRRLARI